MPLQSSRRQAKGQLTECRKSCLCEHSRDSWKRLRVEMSNKEDGFEHAVVLECCNVAEDVVSQGIEKLWETTAKIQQA